MSYVDRGFRQGWYDAQYEMSFYEGSNEYPGNIYYPEDIRDTHVADECSRAAFDFGHKAGWKAFFKQEAAK